MMNSYNYVVRTTDVLGIDAHFMRLLILALFEERDGMSNHIPKSKIYLDIFLFSFMVVPMFIIGLRFWTAPSYLKYNLRINGITAPLAFIPTFFAYHNDVKMLGALVLFMNMYVFWYHIDPPVDVYNDGRNYRRRHGGESDSDNDSDNYERPSQQRGEKFYNSVEKGTDIMRQMAMQHPAVAGF